MIENRAQQLLNEMKADWGDQWQLWLVHPAYDPVIWCARRWDGSGPVLNTDSAGELQKQLIREESRQAGAGS